MFPHPRYPRPSRKGTWSQRDFTSAANPPEFRILTADVADIADAPRVDRGWVGDVAEVLDILRGQKGVVLHRPGRYPQVRLGVVAGPAPPW